MAAKLLWLHAEFLDAAGDSDAADGMFARSYAASGQVWWLNWLAWRDTWHAPKAYTCCPHTCPSIHLSKHTPVQAYTCPTPLAHIRLGSTASLASWLLESCVM